MYFTKFIKNKWLTYLIITLMFFIYSCARVTNPETETPKHLGEETYECYPDKTCNEDLICKDNICEKEYINPCNNITCSDHGRCALALDKIVCICDEGYHSDELNCIEDQDPCKDIDCGTNGVCEVVKNDTICNCNEGYEGERCEIVVNIDYCKDLPCLNGGICKNMINSYECECTNEYSGINCEIKKTGNILFEENFDDGDYTNINEWTLENNDDKPGEISVEEGAIKFYRTNVGGNGGSLGLRINVNKNISENTVLSFDAKATFRDVSGGCGFSCSEYPVSIILYLEDIEGNKFTVRYAVNYGDAVEDNETSTSKRFAISIEQNIWKRDIQYTISEAWPQTVKITDLLIYGSGWSLEGYLDNIKITETR